MKLFKFALILAIVFFFTDAHAQLVSYDNCESDSGLSQYTIQANATNYIQSSTEQKYSGSRSYKFYLQKYNPAQNGATNTEIIYRTIPNFVKGTEYWMGFARYIPKQYAIETNSFLLYGQHHPSPDACDSASLNPNVGFYIKNDGTGRFEVAIGGDPNACTTSNPSKRKTLYTPPYGSWESVVLHFKFSYGSDGYYQVYSNGQLVVDDHGPNANNDTKGPNIKIGAYGHVSENLIVYYDEIRVGTNSNYAEVAPEGGTQTNQLPTCHMDSPVGPQQGTVGSSFNFTSTITDADGTISFINWDFGSGSGISDSSVEDPGSKTYNSEGSFTATLTGTDNQGGTCQASVPITITATPETPSAWTITGNPRINTNVAGFYIEYVSGSGTSVTQWYSNTITAGMNTPAGTPLYLTTVDLNGGSISGTGAIIREYGYHPGKTYTTDEAITLFLSTAGTDPADYTLITEGNAGSFSVENTVYIDTGTTGDTFTDMCFYNLNTSACIDSDVMVLRGGPACVKLTIAGTSHVIDGPSNNVVLPFLLDAGGPLNLSYYSGDGSNEFIMCGNVGNDDLETTSLSLSDVGDMVLDAVTTGTPSKVVNSVGVEMDSYNVPQVTADPTYNVRIMGLPGIIITGSATVIKP